MSIQTFSSEMHIPHVYHAGQSYRISNVRDYSEIRCCYSPKFNSPQIAFAVRRLENKQRVNCRLFLGKIPSRRRMLLHLIVEASTEKSLRFVARHDTAVQLLAFALHGDQVFT